MLKFRFSVCFLAVLTLGRAEFDFSVLKNVITKNGGINSTIIKMIDASAKALPDGILRGNFYNFGSYDSCLAIFDHIGGIAGKYCYTTLSLAEVIALLNKKNKQLLTTYKEIATKKQNLMDKIKPNLNDGSSMGFHFGVCIPHTLSVDFLNDNVPELAFNEDLCYKNVNKEKLEAKHWIALGVIGIFIVLAILSTLYDIITSYGGHKSHEALSAFSVYTNAKKLFKSSTNEDHLLCINGLRALNMTWVIIGHVFVNFLLSGAIDNWQDAFYWMDNVENMGVMGGTVSVDSFFTIAGLLTVYIYMKSADVDLKESVKSVPLMYVHRYLRLTPALAIIVLVHATGLIMFLGNGPRWGLLQPFAVEGCEENWWSTLLYFQNYYMSSSQHMCIDQSWYLSVDMQLFVLSPLILIPLKKWPKYVLPVMVCLIGAGVAIPFYIGYSNKFTGLVMGSTTATFRDQYYFKTHARFGPYVIGMLTGYFIHKMKSGGKKLKLHGVFSSILWLLAIGAMIGCVFDGYELTKDESNAVLDGLFVGLNRSIWSCAISLVILLCVSGNGGFINTFLSLPIMQLLSKLSYSMYLVHYFIISAVNFSRRNSMHFSTYEALFQFISFFILTIFVSIVYTLLFESPVLILERLLFSKLRK